MATITKIEKKIETTREDLKKSLQEVSKILNDRLNMPKQVKKISPAVLIGVTVVGFSLLAMRSKPGKMAFNMFLKSAMGAGVAYMVNNVTKKMKIKM